MTQLQSLQAQLQQMARQLGELAFNREQAEFVYRSATAGLLADMRVINAQVQSLVAADADAKAVALEAIKSAEVAAPAQEQAQ
jgi:hypothetical protein